MRVSNIKCHNWLKVKSERWVNKLHIVNNKYLWMLDLKYFNTSNKKRYECKLE